MTVDKNIMKFEKKGLGNSEKVMDFLALGGVQNLLFLLLQINKEVPLHPRK
jgi:hypothetical protein